MCPGEHDVCFENHHLRSHSARTSVSPGCVGVRAPRRSARHQDGRGETAARAEQALHFRACVVSDGERDVCFEISRLRRRVDGRADSPTYIGSAYRPGSPSTTPGHLMEAPGLQQHSDSNIVVRVSEHRLCTTLLYRRQMVAANVRRELDASQPVRRQELLTVYRDPIHPDLPVKV